MGSANPAKRLIVNADDFGRSRSINAAIIRAHQEGILTTASLMVNGEACHEAVELAWQNPKLGVGLHLTLVCGFSALSAEQIPGLVTNGHCFSDNPVKTGMNLFFRPGLRVQLQREIAAQFRKFEQTRLPLDHVNGHLNIHLHPAVFSLLMQNAERWGIKALRLTRDALRLDLRLGRGRWGYRLSHAFIFGCLSCWAKPALERQKIAHTSTVFGLLQTGCIDEEYLAGLLPALPSGNSELYSHPSLDDSPHELDALVSARVRALIQQHRIQLIRYVDLSLWPD